MPERVTYARLLALLLFLLLSRLWPVGEGSSYRCGLSGLRCIVLETVATRGSIKTLITGMIEVGARCNNEYGKQTK